LHLLGSLSLPCLRRSSHLDAHYITKAADKRRVKLSLQKRFSSTMFAHVNQRGGEQFFDAHQIWRHVKQRKRKICQANGSNIPLCVDANLILISWSNFPHNFCPNSSSVNCTSDIHAVDQHQSFSVITASNLVLS